MSASSVYRLKFIGYNKSVVYCFILLLSRHVHLLTLFDHCEYEWKTNTRASSSFIIGVNKGFPGRPTDVPWQRSSQSPFVCASPGERGAPSRGSPLWNVLRPHTHLRVCTSHVCVVLFFLFRFNCCSLGTQAACQSRNVVLSLGGFYFFFQGEATSEPVTQAAFYLKLATYLMVLAVGAGSSVNERKGRRRGAHCNVFPNIETSCRNENGCSK